MVKKAQFSQGLRDYLQDIEIAMILTALKRCQWNISQTARTLRVQRCTLISKMKRYSITPHMPTH
jgi:sigma-54 specific flagellar transcriptional regulator A